MKFPEAGRDWQACETEYYHTTVETFVSHFHVSASLSFLSTITPSLVIILSGEMLEIFLLYSP